jgi:hypothetical protein
VDAQFPWFAFPLLGWGILLSVHGVYAFVMKTPEEIMIERERQEVSTSTGRAKELGDLAAGQVRPDLIARLTEEFAVNHVDDREDLGR